MNKMKKDKKRQLLNVLNGLILQQIKGRISQAIGKFNKNRMVNRAKKQILLKIIKTRSDKLPSSFNIWKNVPYQQAKKLKTKATKF